MSKRGPRGASGGGVLPYSEVAKAVSQSGIAATRTASM
jgi:hypothetical protein